jgi:FAD/FMN-containing dehydrogenase
VSHELLAALAEIVGADQVVTDGDVLRSHGTDWSGRWAVTPIAVVRPAETDEVTRVLRACAAAHVSVTAQGGNTGLVGGSVPTRQDSVVLSTTRLRTTGKVDQRTRQVTVGAGVTVAELQALAHERGLTYGVDLAARDTATIGGTVATNAGGVRVVHFGDTRSQVVGLEAVFADGSVMSHLHGLPKDSAGYDLVKLLVGSEGTLGVVTAVRVQLHDALPSERVTTLIGVPSLARAVELFQSVAPRDQLLAAEYIDVTGMRLVCEVAQLPHPVGDHWPYYLLVETVHEPFLPEDVDAAVDRRLWIYRERQPEAAATTGLVHSLDVALPLDELDAVVEALAALARPHLVFTFGHLAEGNLHIQVVGPNADDISVTDRVLELVASHGGSVSSEHGVGRSKTRHLALCRDPAQLRAMAAIKNALDPGRLLNPGVLFTPESLESATIASS